MLKILAGVLVVILGINVYYTYRLYTFGKKSQEYFHYLKLQGECTEAAAKVHDAQIVHLSNKTLKPMGNILHVYLAYIPQCKKLAEYRCWMGESEEAIDQCRKDRGFND